MNVINSDKPITELGQDELNSKEISEAIADAITISNSNTNSDRVEVFIKLR